MNNEQNVPSQKKHLRSGLRASFVLLLSLSSGFADDMADPAPGADFSQLSQYLLTLGAFFGYNLTATAPTPYNTLLGQGSPLQAIEMNNLLLQLGAYLNTPTQNPLIDPNSNSPQAALNQYTNAVFKSAGYNTPASNGTLSVSALIDQTPYQTDPVSQSVLDTLTTPDISFCALVTSCTDATSSVFGTAGANAPTGNLQAKCCSNPALYQSRIGINVLGSLPQPNSIADALDPAVIQQLNSNSLIAPMLYATSTSGSNTTNHTPPLTAASQAQVAANFIRYVSSAVSPPPQTDMSTYLSLYNIAMGLPNPKPPPQTEQQIASTQQAKAQQQLSNYFASMRTFSAQNSVGVANLYGMLLKRMPQNLSGAANAPSSSQALNEYVMATRRLNDVTLNGNSNNQWVELINNGSPATVQKEMATLLSEMNYQLYLNRQIQERILLTNTVLIFQLSRLVMPPPLQAPQQ